MTKAQEQAGFPIGALVLVDGKRKARVAGYFPEGSSFFPWPHYSLHFVGGDKNVKVQSKRVGAKP